MKSVRIPRIWLGGLWLCAALAASGVDAQDLELLRNPTNSAISVPMGQGLDLVHAAEALGKSRYRLRIINRSQSVTVPEFGDGSLYTGYYGFGYGVSDALDLSLVVPFLMDSAGGLNKYGTGDPVLGIKLSRPPRALANMHTGFQLLLGLPLGYKGEHALDKIGGIRRFSSEALDLGLQFLMDVHFRPMSLYLNGGFFRPGNPNVVTQVVYGLGVEAGRRNRWVSMNAEYQARVAFAQQARASNIMKFGARIRLVRGVQLELGREIGFLDHPTDAMTTVGIRTHGYFSGGQRFESRYTLYEPPPPPRRLYDPRQVLKIAVLSFSGFEEYRAGERLVERIAHELAPHDSLEFIDLTRYKGVPRTGTLSGDEALDLAQKLGADVVISGEVADYSIRRFAGPTVPYLFELPTTEVNLSLRFHIRWFPDATRVQLEALTEEVSGRGVLRKRLRLLPADRRDITVGRLAGELEAVHDAALDDLVGNMLASLASQFSWVPPDFMYANN